MYTHRRRKYNRWRPTTKMTKRSNDDKSNDEKNIFKENELLLIFKKSILLPIANTIRTAKRNTRRIRRNKPYQLRSRRRKRRSGGGDTDTDTNTEADTDVVDTKPPAYVDQMSSTASNGIIQIAQSIAEHTLRNVSATGVALFKKAAIKVDTYVDSGINTFLGDMGNESIETIGIRTATQIKKMAKIGPTTWDK